MSDSQMLPPLSADTDLRFELEQGVFVSSLSAREICTALRDGNTDEALVLIGLPGADLNGYDEYGWTPLVLSLSLNRWDVAQTLLARGVDHAKTAFTGEGAFDQAISVQNAEATAFFLDHGVSANGVDRKGVPLLALAIQTQQEDMVDLLLASGADPARPLPDGRTGFDLAAESASFGIRQIFTALSEERLAAERLAAIVARAVAVQNDINTIAQRQRVTQRRYAGLIRAVL